MLIAVVVLVALTIGGFVGFQAYLDHAARQEWNDAVAEADRLDPGWRWNDLIEKLPVPVNGHNSVDAVAALGQRLSRLNAAGAAKPLDLGRWIVAGRTPYRLPNHLPTPDLAAAEAAITGASGDYSDLDQIGEKSTGRFAIPGSPVLRGAMPDTRDSLDIVKQLVFTRLAMRAERGDADAALGDVRLIVAVARPAADAPDMALNLYSAIERMIAARGVERVLCRGEPSLMALSETRRLLELEARRPIFLPAFRGDRARIGDTLEAMDGGRLSRDEVEKSLIFADPVQLTGWKTADEWLTRLIGARLRRSTGVALFRHDTRVIEWFKESPDGPKAHEEEWLALRSTMTGSAKNRADYLARYVADFRPPAAILRFAIAALAAEQFRRETGRWPATLEELVPSYLSAVPIDPSDLKPLRLARRPDGIVICSVGSDPGLWDALAAGSTKPTDVGIRLWDVAKRRQPPSPKPAQ